MDSGALTRERVNRQQYRTRAEARADLFDYMDAETIMAITGHRSIAMYLRYRSVRPERLDVAMARLDAATNTLITHA